MFVPTGVRICAPVGNPFQTYPCYDSPMKGIRGTLAITAVVIGLALIISGLNYSVSHLDTGPAPGDSFLVTYKLDIGLFVLVLAPFLLRLYVWGCIQLLATVLFITKAFG